MTIGITTLIIWSALLVLMLTVFPVAFFMLIIAVVGYIVFVSPEALYTISPIVFRNLTTDIYIAIPLFVFMAAVFQVSGGGDARVGTREGGAGHWNGDDLYRGCGHDWIGRDRHGYHGFVSLSGDEEARL